MDYSIVHRLPSLISLLRGILGVISLLLIAYLCSNNRRSIDWKLVRNGLILQIVLAVCVIYVPFVREFFGIIAKCFIQIFEFAKTGAIYVFGPIADRKEMGYIFAFQALPSIIFFSALISVFYYYGLIQKFIKFTSWLLKKALKISGVESIVSTINIFVGMSEAPIFVKPYLPKITASELFLILVVGMSTMSGGLVSVYSSMLAGEDYSQMIVFATHILSASVMAVPGAVVLSKIFFPQVESVEQEYSISRRNFGANPISSMLNGMQDGLRMCVSIAVSLLVFVALIEMVDYLLALMGRIGNFNGWIAYITDGRFQELSLGLILGTLFSPLMWLIGCPFADIIYMGQLQGLKITLTELVGFSTFTDMKMAGGFANAKSVVMSTYMLSGFANIASVGILIGAIGALSPNHKDFVSSQCFKAMIAASLASLLSATIIGVML